MLFKTRANRITFAHINRFAVAEKDVNPSLLKFASAPYARVDSPWKDYTLADPV
jgi:hypothetical protein